MGRDRSLEEYGDGRPWWLPGWLRLPERPRNAQGWALWAVALIVVVYCLLLLWRLAVAYWYLALPVVAGIAFVADRYWRSLWEAEQERRRRIASYSLTFDEMRAMHWREFELAVVRLMLRDGIAAKHTGKTGDFSGDVVGYDAALDETWMVQVKHYGPNTKVKSEDVQKVAGAAWPIYQARMKLVVTTSGYTRDAVTFSEKAGIHLIDKPALIRWATDGVHLHDVLGISATSRRKAAG